ncbi:MAG: efflux RND transporter periplasmic adaptor subunit [Pseudomonadota bacterium]
MNAVAFRRWGGALAVLGFGVIAAWILVAAKPAPEAAPIPVQDPPLVTYLLAEPEALQLTVTTQGTVEPARKVVLSSEVGGRVIRTSAKYVDGGFFRANETLLQLETADYELAITRAESSLATARQELAQEEGRALQAKREWRELKNIKANALFLREPQLAAAKAKVAAAEAELGRAHRNLANTTISLPFDGRVITRNAGLGQFVSPGTTLATVYGSERVNVRLPITDRQLALLDLPLTASPREAENYPKAKIVAQLGGRAHEWTGVIRRTDALIDETSRTLYAIAEIDQPFTTTPGTDRPPLMPGMFVEAELEGRLIPGLTRLPRSAITNENTLRIVDAESTIRERLVQSIHRDQRSVWITDLQGGERVVVSDTALLQAGTAVTAVLAEQFALEEHSPWAQ